MDIDKIAMIAQQISFAFEDNFHDKSKKELFVSIFNEYLAEVDPGITTDPYDAVIALGQKDPLKFDRMLAELKAKGLLSG